MKNSGGEYMEFRYKVLVIDDDSSVSFYIKATPHKVHKLEIKHD